MNILTGTIGYDFGGSYTRILVSGAQTGDAYCVLEMASPAGRATPMHHHDHEEETLIMLEGELQTVGDDASQTLRVGESATFGRGTRHKLINSGTQTARYLVICAPAGFDRFVQACAEPREALAETQEPDDAFKARMRAAAERFGITLHAPAPVSV
ncbi:cupin domain-containing protein [Paraburkholderia sp. GAS199]|uniref:cupin domain-containing protein n=1 Tax=Paraburkholderia sp. GAS199 TaxID=3035126 RepID=UPI003D1C47AC